MSSNVLAAASPKWDRRAIEVELASGALVRFRHPVGALVKTRPRIKGDRRVGQRREARVDRRQADMERRLDDMRHELDVQFKRIVDIQLAIDRLEALQK